MARCDGGDIAIVGATGAVGVEVASILSAMGVAASRVRCFASDRSEGRVIAYGAGSLAVERIGAEAFRGAAVAFFVASGDAARAHAGAAMEAGALVIDNSSAFRLEDGVPLVVPEVNGAEVDGSTRLAANPNCSTIILATALEPLRKAFGIAAVDVATYQAVSGAGLAAMRELREQTEAALAGRTVTPRVFRETCAFNVFSHDSAVDPETGVNGEERKIIDEARKIWGDGGVRITPTCCRVPVFRSHTQAITVTVRRRATEAEVRGALARGAGIRVVDDRGANRFPTPVGATGGDAVVVGRIRPDPADGVDGRGASARWCLMVAGDQLRKGAALNAVQIARLARPGALGTGAGPEGLRAGDWAGAVGVRY